MNIHHGHFINNDHVRFQRVLCISLKMHRLALFLLIRHPTEFQKPVNGLRLISGSLCHSLGCPSCRCCKPKVCPFSFKKANNGIDCSSFTGPRASCQNKQPMAGSFCHCFFLHFVQNRTCFLLNPGQPTIYKLLVFRAEDIQFLKHSGCIQFQVIILGRIYQNLFFFLFLDDLSIHGKIHKVLLHIGRVYSQKPG